MFVTFLWMILPVFLMFILQVLVSFVTFFVSIFGYAVSAASSGGEYSMEGMLEQVTNLMSDTDKMLTISLIYAIISIVIMAIWYKKIKNPSYGSKGVRVKTNHGLLAVGIVLLAVTMQRISAYIMALTTVASPGALEKYNELMELSGLSQDEGVTIPVILYAVLLGPLSEELIFRGVVMKTGLKKFSFFTVNIIQAALFGMFHMNVVQGLYTFFVGLCLGYVAYRTKGIKTSYLLHLVYNICGVFGMVNIFESGSILAFAGLVATFAIFYMALHLTDVATGVRSLD